VPDRLAEEDQSRGAIVALEVLRKAGGEPDEQLAAGLRIMIQNEGMISRPPSAAELDFLKYLRQHDGYDQRNLRISSVCEPSW
jgi:hypothetical protein